jgi:OHCU decarboxylase
MITLETLNTLSVEAFTEILGAVFEHSPWVAQRAFAARPFTSRLELLDVMRGVVQEARVEEQLALIQAHPQLGARGRKRLELTESSSREQRRAGLDACTDEEFVELMRLNTAYVETFSFPFILAVRGHDPRSILESMQSRLESDQEGERHTALTQIGLIGGYRLADVVASPPAAEATAMVEGLTATAEGATAALLREWMLAANFDVSQGHTSTLLGVNARFPKYLAIGIFYDPTTQALYPDGRLAAVLGIAVAQHLRQEQTPTRLGLLVMAAPTAPQPGSILLDLGQPVDLVPTQIDARITDQCLTIVQQPTALPEGNAAAIDRAIRTLEHLLI